MSFRRRLNDYEMSDITVVSMHLVNRQFISVIFLFSKLLSVYYVTINPINLCLRKHTFSTADFKKLLDMC